MSNITYDFASEKQCLSCLCFSSKVCPDVDARIVALTTKGNFAALPPDVHFFDRKVIDRFRLFLKQRYGLLAASIALAELPKNLNSLTVSDFLYLMRQAEYLSNQKDNRLLASFLDHFPYGFLAGQLFSHLRGEQRIEKIVELAPKTKELENFVFSLKALRIYEIFCRNQATTVYQLIDDRREVFVENEKGKRELFDLKKLIKSLNRIQTKRSVPANLFNLISKYVREEQKNTLYPSKVTIRRSIVALFKAYKIEIVPQPSSLPFIVSKKVCHELMLIFSRRCKVIFVEKNSNALQFEKGSLKITSVENIISIVADLLGIPYLESQVNALIEAKSWKNLPSEYIRAFYEKMSQPCQALQEYIPTT